MEVQMNLTKEQKEVIRNSVDDFNKKFNHFKDEWEKMGYGEYLSNELAWDSFLFMKSKTIHQVKETSKIINDIQKLSPHPTEAITLFYNMENTTLEEINNIFDSVKNNFPKNKVIAIPNKTSLESCSKDVLENIISMISEIIEEL